MADVKPFRAVRYSGAAGSLADLVAPPYDAVDEAERARLFTRSPYNVIHVTLPESADEAASLYRAWLPTDPRRTTNRRYWSSRIRGPDESPASAAEWRCPRRGAARDGDCSPTSAPSAHPRSACALRAIRVQPEPIFLLTGRPDLDAEQALISKSMRHACGGSRHSTPRRLHDPSF
jgi:hypothetical protein